MELSGYNLISAGQWLTPMFNHNRLFSFQITNVNIHSAKSLERRNHLYFTLKYTNKIVDGQMKMVIVEGSTQRCTNMNVYQGEPFQCDSAETFGFRPQEIAIDRHTPVNVQLSPELAASFIIKDMY